MELLVILIEFLYDLMKWILSTDYLKSRWFND